MFSPFKHILIYSAIILLAVSANGQSPVSGWILDNTTSLGLNNDTITAQSGNSGPRAIAPILVINPCSYTVASPYIETTVVGLPVSIAGSAKIVMGFKMDDVGSTDEYTFEITNSTSKFNPTIITTKINGTTQTSTSVSGTTGGGDVYKLLIYDSYTLRLYRNGTLVQSLAFGSAKRGRFFVEAYYGAAGAASIRNTTAHYPCTNSSFYAGLQSKLDGGFVQLYDNNLRFKFIQEYASATNNVSYTIYDWNRTHVVSPTTFTATHGINWKSISVSSLSSGTYVLELTGNKNQKYYLRFKK